MKHKASKSAFETFPFEHANERRKQKVNTVLIGSSILWGIPLQSAHARSALYIQTSLSATSALSPMPKYAIPIQKVPGVVCGCVSPHLLLFSDLYSVLLCDHGGSASRLRLRVFLVCAQPDLCSCSFSFNHLLILFTKVSK